MATVMARVGKRAVRRDPHILARIRSERHPRRGMESPPATLTKRSGKSRIVTRRLACNPRLRNALYHRARIAAQHDPRSRAKYAALRQRGHSHARALRSVGDRLLNVACAMLRNGTQFNPSWAGQKNACQRVGSPFDPGRVVTMR
jgi:hypothetical protein